jgi:hypothetical protein
MRLGTDFSEINSEFQCLSLILYTDKARALTFQNFCQDFFFFYTLGH